MDEKLRELFCAAAAAFERIQTNYERVRPEDHGAFMALHERGVATPFVMVTLAPKLGMQFGFEYQGVPNVIHQLNILPEDEALPQ